MGRVEKLAEGVTLEEARKLTRTQRYRLRKRGVDVPFVPQRSGFTQTAEHIEKRKRIGEANYAWQGTVTNKKNGRKRAWRMFPLTEPCADCDNPDSERHHVDRNTSNNSPENVKFLCRRCHLIAHGKRPSSA